MLWFCGSWDGWAGLKAAREDRGLAATAVVGTWLRRNDCHACAFALSRWCPARGELAWWQQQAPSRVPRGREHQVGCETAGPTTPLLSRGRPMPVNRDRVQLVKSQAGPAHPVCAGGEGFCSRVCLAAPGRRTEGEWRCSTALWCWG